MELKLSNHDNSRALQYEQEAIKKKMLMLEMDAKSYNAKIRGMPEQVESNTDLQIFISPWLAMKLQLEKGIVPNLTKVYRIGAPKSRRWQGPCDILKTFLNMKDEIKLITEARKRGHLSYNGERIEIF